MEGKRSRWGGWPSKPERAVRRFLVGSTPTLFRHPHQPDASLIGGLSARLKDVLQRPRFAVLADGFADFGVPARIGDADELFGLGRAGHGHGMGDRPAVLAAGDVGRHVFLQAGVAGGVGDGGLGGLVCEERVCVGMRKR